MNIALIYASIQVFKIIDVPPNNNLVLYNLSSCSVLLFKATKGGH